MKRILTFCLVLAVVASLAVPAFAVELESSVTSGDTITDTYAFPVESIYYETTTGDGLVSSNELSLSLPEGDWASLEVYYDSANDLSAFNMDGYTMSSVKVDVSFSIVGGVDYTVGLSVGDGSVMERLDEVRGQTYDSNESLTLSGSLDLTYNRGIFPEVYIDFYSLSTNVWVQVDAIKLTIERKRVDRYEPDYTVPGDGIGEELDDVEKDALDQVGDGQQAFEDVQIGVLDTMATYATSFLAVAYILDTFLEIEFVDHLLVISLAVGSFALLLGLTLSFTRGKD